MKIASRLRQGYPVFGVLTVSLPALYGRDILQAKALLEGYDLNLETASVAA